MNTKRDHSGTSHGGAIVWILLAVVVAGIVYFIVTKKRAPVPEPAIAVATPAPATPIPATPTPVVVKATPTPAPVAAATPMPKPVATPPSLDLAMVARTPALWPAQVALVEPKSFPLWLNGRAVGETKAPAGTVMRLLRVAGQQVEVEYQSHRYALPVVMTDLMARALVAFRNAGSVLPEAAKTAAAPTVTEPTTQPSAATGGLKIGNRVAMDVVRQKRSRIEGGDFDDKKDRISLKVKISNTDTTSAEGLKGQICVLGESILDRRAVKMLAKQEFTFSLPARGSHELLTDEVETAYDTTGARFGYRYEGWLLRIHDSAGNLVAEKSTSPSLIKQASKVTDMAVGSSFDRNTMAVKASIPLTTH